ncbi:E3 ubiquitin-protein ligase UBR1 [Reticulomyxa filosa]|uniref:E3 ubiquitin-protein ligase n=1 Tax=Reticulomyxa filosa TaxID=46433 RepID=X6MMI1_RETFI|nr:E3 ubiquitin-protein ligase UBR1 [Reticulomyxa filosa]|eukprot:ETO14846.1 E3 ubiquitin-protein ligase UBR1 [Reticulomyxa filosa]
MPKFAFQDQPQQDLEIAGAIINGTLFKHNMHVCARNEVLSSLQANQQAPKKKYLSQLNNILYYKNETETDTIEFGWQEIRYVGSSMEDDIFPLMLCDVLSHSISSLETRFRIYTRQDIYDHLYTQLQFHNTAITSIWRLFTTYSLVRVVDETSVMFTDRAMHRLYQSCWMRLFMLFGQDSTVNDMYANDETIHYNDVSDNVLSYENAVHTQDPFHVMVRAFLTHPYLFSLRNTDDLEWCAEMEPLVSPTINDLYHVLLSCYVWKLLQVLLTDIVEEEEKEATAKLDSRSSPLKWMTILQTIIIDENESKDEMKEENKKRVPMKGGIIERLCFFVLPFLRRCYILLYSTGLIQLDLDLLWSCLSINSATLPMLLQNDPNVFEPAKVIAECDAICRALFLPTLREYVTFTFGTNTAQDNDKANVLSVMQCWTQTFFERLTNAHCQYIKCMRGVDSISPISLVSMPHTFADLYIVLSFHAGFCLFCFALLCFALHCRVYRHIFVDLNLKQRTCKEKCFAAQIPKNSAICLFCGAFLCLRCCRSNEKGALTIHSKHCGLGKGLFMCLQQSIVILMYEHAAIAIPSPYVDSHGQDDIGVNQQSWLSLNFSRLHGLWKIVADGAIPNNVCQLRDDNCEASDAF